MKQEYYISLITKNISEQLSDAEMKQLNEWLAIDSENAALKSRIEKTWKDAAHYKSDMKVNENAAWENISKQLIEQKPKVETPVVSMWRKPLSIAATLLFLLAGTWFFFNNGGKEVLTYTTAMNETKNIELPDGSKVTLNQSSMLIYGEAAGKRICSLAKGEGFFEVVHNKAKPFIVMANETTTTVLGTVFNVNANSKNNVEVMLLEGKISFEAPDIEKVILSPNEKVNYTKANKDLARTTVKNENEVAWKTKQLDFKNTKITEVIETINQYFEKDIELTLKDGTCLFTSSFDNPKYEEVLEVMKFTYDLNIENENGKSRLIINKCK